MTDSTKLLKSLEFEKYIVNIQKKFKGSIGIEKMVNFAFWNILTVFLFENMNEN